MDVAKPFGWKAAERIFELVTIGGDLELRADGVYLSDGFAEAARFMPTLLWVPKCAMLDADPQDAALLPVPFSGRDLAAFFLSPVAIGVGLDELKESLSGVRDGFVLRAVEEARQEFARAEKIVGPLDEALRNDAERLAENYNQQRNLNRALLGISNVTSNGFSDDEYSRRIGLANDDVREANEASLLARRRADEYEIDWRNRMVRSIYLQKATVAKHLSVTAAPAGTDFCSVTAASQAPLVATQVDVGTAPNDASSSSTALWRLKRINRADDLRLALHAHLQRADKTVSPPGARLVLDTWLIDRPPRITRVHADGLDYPANGRDGEKTARIGQIQDRIDNLVERLHAG